MLINKEVIVFGKMLNMTFILGNSLSRKRIFRLVSQELVCKKKFNENFWRSDNRGSDNRGCTVLLSSHRVQF